jgi:hypothetical protein
MSAYPSYWPLSAQQEGDRAIKRFVDEVWEHREGCPVCQEKRPCHALRATTDAVAEEIRAIGQPHFEAWTKKMEAVYGPEADYWRKKRGEA